MWSSAQAADTQTAWQQVNAWRRTHDLLLHHAGRLKACADELTYAWPPGKSPAAQAFVDHITQLRTAILQASADAATNYSAIAGVLSSLSSAKSDMAKLMAEWESFENAATAEQARRSLLEGSDSREALNAKARTRMAQNDQEVLEASRRFVKLTPPSERATGDPEVLGPGTYGGAASGRPQTEQGGGGLSSSRMIAPPVNPIDAIDTQVGLAGSSATPTRVEPPGTAGATAGHSSPSGSATVGPIAGGLGKTAGSHGQAVGKVGQGVVSTEPVAGYSRTAGGASSLPAPAASTRGPARVNPVGGVIESNRPASPHGAFPVTGGARPSVEGFRDSTAARTLQWEVLEGVSPVIEPVPEVPFELGPGVIGIDR